MQWFSFFNNWWRRQNSLWWQCLVYYNNLWNLWNGNTWPLYVHMGLVIMHGRPDVTLIGLAAHDVLLSSFLPPDKRLCNSYLHNNSFGFDNLHWIWKLVVYIGAAFDPLRHMADLGVKIILLYPLADAAFQRPLSRLTSWIQILWSEHRIVNHSTEWSLMCVWINTLRLGKMAYILLTAF